MTETDFREQMRRLRVRFGEKNFDAEFVMLIWRECHDMSAQSFQRTVDVFIGSRPTTRPPLLTDFREARLKDQQNNFKRDLSGATNTLKRQAPEEMRKHLRVVLNREYGGCESAADALEVAKLKARLQHDDDGGAA